MKLKVLTLAREQARGQLRRGTKSEGGSMDGHHPALPHFQILC